MKRKGEEFIADGRHWVIPGKFTERVTRKQLREVLLRGDVAVKGRVVPWKFRHLGVGVYELSVDYPPLEEKG